MARGKPHSDEVRAQVMAALLAGQGVSEIAARYRLDKAVVSRWKKLIPADELQQVATKKKETLLDLVEGHLTASLKAAITLAERCSTDIDWFGRQSASEIAVLYGVLSDKAIRVLDAAERAAERDRAAESERPPAKV